MMYLPEEGIWRQAPMTGEQAFEIVVAGDAFAPSPQHAALLTRILPQIEPLINRATQYLDCFAKRPEAEEWFFESLDLTGEAMAFDLSFTLDSDLYGDWRVTFVESIEGFSPIEFCRRQV